MCVGAVLFPRVHGKGTVACGACEGAVGQHICEGEVFATMCVKVGVYLRCAGRGSIRAE
jgi:hypothetical protein